MPRTRARGLLRHALVIAIALAAAYAAVAAIQTAFDPAVMGKDWPDQYDSFKKMSIDTSATPYAGSKPFDRLERYPILRRLYAPNPFSIEYNEDRGHHYGLIDQKRSLRVTTRNQPAACANCHASEAPALIEKMGWEKFNGTPYNEIKDQLHYGTTCADCHDPETLELRISRQALKNAMKERGVDLSQASRQQMKSYVCAQCHVEYFFKGDNKVLTFPWKSALTVDNIEAYYDEAGFSDWKHAETGAAMIKIQHPDFEMWSTGIHAKSGVACADCHMPAVKKGSSTYTDHWIRSPLLAGMKSCKTCHARSEKDLRGRVALIQDRTAELLKNTETALGDAIDAIAAAQKSGATDADLAKARQLHRSAQLRWDFVASENSTGFHSAQESARILATAIDRARQSQLEAVRRTK